VPRDQIQPVLWSGQNVSALTKWIDQLIGDMPSPSCVTASYDCSNELYMNDFCRDVDYLTWLNRQALDNNYLSISL
jgi:hypothetical protein